MRNKTVCFTGHRKIPQSELKEVTERLKITLIKLIDNGYCYFGVGGALGFDTVAAQTVLILREKYPQMKLILVLPCYSQTRGWKEDDIRMYDYIKTVPIRCVILLKSILTDVCKNAIGIWLITAAFVFVI